MPVYAYRCRTCRHEFELLVFSGDTPACPQCGSTTLDRTVTVCAVQTSGRAVSPPRTSGRSGCGGCSGGNCTTCR